MMRTMRASAKWVMGVVAFFFVGWMIYGYGMDITGRGSASPNTVAKVNGEKIDVTTFYTAVQNEQELIRQQRGSAPVTLEEQQALEDRVLDQLVQEIVLRQEFRRRRIRVSDQEIVEAVRTSPPPELQNAPEFQTEGQFDMQKYQRFIGSSADRSFLIALEARYRDELPKIKFYNQITVGMYISDSELWQQYRDLSDSVEAVVLALYPQVVPDSLIDIDEDDLRSYYDAHRDDFERPATAYLSYITLSQRTNAADSAAALARAAAVRAELVDGAEFAAVAERESADSVSAAEGGDLGEARMGQFVPAFEEAALALRPGELSEPVLSPFGYHLIRLESRTDTTFTARHILIPVELAGDHLDAVESRADTLDLFAAEQDDPAALEDVAGRLNVPVLQAPPLPQGDRLRVGGMTVGDAGVWAFGDAEGGLTSPVVETVAAYFVFRLDSLLPAGIPDFEAVRGEVVAAATVAAKQTRTEETAREIAADIATGVTLEDAASRRGFATRTVGPFTRYAPAPVFQGSPAAAGAAFAMGVEETSGPVPGTVGIFFVRPIRKILADSAAFLEQLDTQRLQALSVAGQQRVQMVVASLLRSANIQDLRLELARAQRAAEEQGLIPNPLGF